MAPEKKTLWQQILTIITIVGIIFGGGVAWQAVQSKDAEHDQKIERIEQVQTLQQQKSSVRDRKMDEFGINLKILMRSQGLEYQRVDE